MSMLAERKKREKWALNPRGKAWSEDPNKFGQRLMEKMGWKSGQGLGAKSQGQTDIVKTRVKNDCKGLGFKDNGEEWLKTTSDFDNLLEELASSKEDSGDGSQSETPSSLEDRSKKSRARVHYHKFTRGKDISRYSEKDLASIIGPEVIKLKSGKESKSDYTQNQVNKGSIQDYFNKKSQVEKKSTDDDSKGGEILANDYCGKVEDESESAVDVRPKKKKNKREINDNLDEVKSSTVSESCVGKNDPVDLEISSSGKKKRNKKNNPAIENDSQDIDENDPDSTTLVSAGIVIEGSEEFKNSCKSSKKRKTCNSDVENLVVDAMQYPCEIDSDAKTPKKKKMKSVEDDEQSSNNDLGRNSSFQSADNEDVVTKKEKKKAKLESEYNVNPVALDGPVSNEEPKPKKKKKKSKEKSEEHLNDLNEEEIGKDFKCINNNSSGIEEGITHEKIVKKKRKKVDEKIHDEELIVKNEKHTKDKEHGKEIPITSEDAPQCEQVTNDDTEKSADDFLVVRGRRTRLKKLKTVCKTTNNQYKTEDYISLGETDDSKQKNVEEHSSLPFEKDVDTEKIIVRCKSNRSDIFCPQKVIWFENKLVKKKLIKHTDSKLFKRKLSDYAVPKRPCILIIDSQNLSSTVVKKLKEIHTIRYYKSFLTDEERSEIDAAVKKYRESLKLPGDSVPKDVNQNPVTPNSVQGETSKITTDPHNNENFESTETKEGMDELSNKENHDVKCYIEGTPDECNFPKHVVAYEYRLVVARLKQLDITPPEVKVAVKESYKFGYNTCRKLKHIAKIRYLKKLLPPKDFSEIETLVSKFHDDLKPKIEIMDVFTQLDEKKLEITKCLNEINESQLDKVGATKNLWAEKSEVMSDLFKKLETGIDNFKKTNGKPVTSGDSIKETLDCESVKSQNESSCEEIKWLKKVENDLDIWKKHMEMLSKGIMPPDLIIKSQKAEKRKIPNDQVQGNSKYSKVNNKCARARGVSWGAGRATGFGRGFSEGREYVEAGGSCKAQGFPRGNQSYRGEFNRGRGRGRGRGFIEGGDGGVPGTNGPWAPQGITRGGQSYRGHFCGRVALRGRGRAFSSGPSGGMNESWQEHGQTRASQNYRRDSYGQGFSSRGFTSRGRGRGRGDMRGRGRISQNNLEAKLYAEKCKELNKVPEICFNGVDLKFISGYAANVTVDKNVTNPAGVSSQVNSQAVASGISFTKGKDAEKLVQER